VPSSENTAAGLLLAGTVLTVAGLLAFLWSRLGPRPFRPERQAEAERLQQATRPVVTLVTETIEGVPALVPVMTPTPHPHAAWMYDGVDMASGQEVAVAIGSLTMLQDFKPNPWTPDALERGIFDLGDGTALAWADDVGRVGLWMHSGLHQTASALQEFIERDGRGYLRTTEEAETILSDELIGRGVLMLQGGHTSRSVITAAVRVPPLEVERLQPHVGDLVEYLAASYPGDGFEALVERKDVLLFFFCGLRLGGERDNPEEGYYRQARFIIALTPEVNER
jgi:hypothetical protein